MTRYFPVPGKVTRLTDCHNVEDFRELAWRRLPFPVFHYIDGGADDELTKSRNTDAFTQVDLVPTVLAGTKKVDTSRTIMGRKTSLPLLLSPTALQRLFHWHGERAVARAAEKHNLWFGVSCLSTVSIEEIGADYAGPKMLQLYHHRDEGLNGELLERAGAAGFDAVALTVDTIVSGNRERCKRTGFKTPPEFSPRSFLSYATRPGWALNFLFRERFGLPNLENHIREGSRRPISIQDYFDKMLDRELDWRTVEKLRADWSGKLCLKGIMSASDARRAADIGCDAIMVSNHGGRQLDGSRAPFDQIREIVDAVGERLEVICDGGVRRGTHVLKALAAGAHAVSGGRMYLYALAAAGEPGVDRAVGRLSAEIERGMRLMGVHSVEELDRSLLRFR